MGLCEGRTIVSDAEFASAASAISVTRVRAQSSFPAKREVEEFIAMHRPINKNNYYSKKKNI